MSEVRYRVKWKEFIKTGKVEIISIEPQYNISEYFRQQEFIKGTYIRKDKFNEVIEVNYINPIIRIPNDKEFLDELRRIAREVGFIPITTKR